MYSYFFYNLCLLPSSSLYFLSTRNKARLCQLFFKGLHCPQPCGSLLKGIRYYSTIYLCLPLCKVGQQSPECRQNPSIQASKHLTNKQTMSASLPGVLLSGVYSTKETNKQSWGQHGLLTLKAKQARQLVDNAYLSWTCSVLRAVFVLKAIQSWLKLKHHEWKRLRGFTVWILIRPTKQTNLKAKPARQLVDNAYLSWTWSALQAVFVLKARPS